MNRRRPAFLRRSIANENRRRLQARSESSAQGAAFRWAAVAVALVTGLAVMVGFTDRGRGLAGFLGGLGFLSRPLVFGITGGDLVAVLLALLAACWFLYRDWRRANPRKTSER